MKNHVFLTIFLVLIAILGCRTDLSNNNQNNNQTSPMDTSTKPIIDIPKLANADIKVVEKTFGKPIQIIPIKNYPDQMPGEYRDYQYQGTTSVSTENGVEVKYYKGRLVSIRVDFIQGSNVAKDLLNLANIDVGNTKPDREAILGVHWIGVFNGLNYKAISVYRMKTTDKWQTLQAQF